MLTLEKEINEKLGDLARGVYRAVDSSFISTKKNITFDYFS
jgi:hypothetical protein